MHWINFPLLALMIWSGILIYWADDAFIPIPDPLARALGINHHLAEGMGWHFFLMWPFAVNGMAHALALGSSGEWRELWPARDDFRDAVLVTLHDLHLRREAPPLRGKYNAAQRIAYTGVNLMGLGSLLTGLAIYKPVQAGWLTALLGGYEAARLEHFVLMCGFVTFFVIHVAQVARAGWNCFRAMVAGYEIK